VRAVWHILETRDVIQYFGEYTCWNLIIVMNLKEVG